jgi:hypothetical protein
MAAGGHSVGEIDSTIPGRFSAGPVPILWPHEACQVVNHAVILSPSPLSESRTGPGNACLSASVLSSPSAGYSFADRIIALCLTGLRQANYLGCLRTHCESQYSDERKKQGIFNHATQPPFSLPFYGSIKAFLRKP